MRGRARLILVLLGPPGVGKGTQGARIAVHYDIPTISTGAILRDAVARGTKWGRIVQQYKIELGQYVPDNIIVEIVKERTAEPDCERGFLLDGFPRTIPQADALGVMLTEQGAKVNGVMDFEAPIEEIVKRISGRRVCPVDGSTYHVENQPPLQPGLCDICKSKLVTRPDDDPEVVKRRLEVYFEKTRPLLDYYHQKGLLHTIDATPEPETVFGQVVATIDRLKSQR